MGAMLFCDCVQEWALDFLDGVVWLSVVRLLTPLMECVQQVVYDDIPGWEEDISAIRRYEDLPAAAQAYVERIEALVGLPICYIGVGPGRDALIVKQ